MNNCYFNALINSLKRQFDLQKEGELYIENIVKKLNYQIIHFQFYYQMPYIL